MLNPRAYQVKFLVSKFAFTCNLYRYAGVELGLLTAAQFDAWVRPEEMTSPSSPPVSKL